MSHSTRKLNDLVAIARDGKSFYDHAAPKVDDATLKTLFSRIAAVKGDIVQGLSGEVRAEGDTPADSGTLVGGISQVYGDVRALLGNKDYAYVAQLEEAEDRMIKAFDDALADKELAPAAVTVLTRLAPEVRQCHELMRTRKLALKNAA
jgi:uncharacterized protein (TIGR02284 family)